MADLYGAPHVRRRERLIACVSALALVGSTPACAAPDPAKSVVPPPAVSAPAAGSAGPAAAPAPPIATPSWWYAPPPLLTAALSGFFGLAGTALALQFGWWNTKTAINQKANEAELAAIRAKLDAFYGPYLQRSEENKLLAAELHSRQPPGFRTLLGLVDPRWYKNLTKAESTLVDEIVANGIDLRAMMRERAGAVDPAVLPYLARAGTHFTMLILAKAGSLDGDPERYRHFVYPRQLDPVLRADMARLEARATLLRSALLVRHDPAPCLVVPDGLALDPWPSAIPAPKAGATPDAVRVLGADNA